MRFLATGALLDGFRRLLDARLGLHFDENRSGQLSEVLGDRLAATGHDAPGYLEYLESARGETEWLEVAQRVTVGETYFFRHTQQFDAFREILSSSSERQSGGLRVLSAGCASGEEAYSIAMVAREMAPNRRLSVVAVDINRASLDRARAGCYSAWSLRETPEPVARRWFQSKGRDFVLDPSIRGDVNFRIANLAKDDLTAFGVECYDVIFCRNVLMYFSIEACRQAVQRLTRALAPGGFLFMGSAETLRGISQDYHLCQRHEAFYYQVKSPERHEAAPNERALEWSAAGQDWVAEIGRAAARVAALSLERPVAQLPLGKLERPSALRSDLVESFAFLEREQFSRALGAVRALPAHAQQDPDVLLVECMLLASDGKFVEAESVSRRLLALDGLNAGAHYVLGLCDAGNGQLDPAVQHHRVATYLDPEFAMPHLQLGLLLQRTGDVREAELALRHARTLLERENAARLLMFGGGFKRSALLEICSTELSRLGGSC
jgi:chemotaxis protein methyltransferase CheR